MKVCFRKVLQEDVSLTGASGKVGLYYDEKEEKWYLPLGVAASNKYEKNNEGYLKKLFDVIRAYSADPMVEI